MAHPLTDNPANFNTVSVPDDGDARNAASVEAPFQVLADRTAHLDANKPETAAVNLRIGGCRFQLSGSGVTPGNKLTVSNAAGPSPGFSASSDEITVPSTGYYLVNVCVHINVTGGAGTFGLRLELNNTGVISRDITIAGNGTYSIDFTMIVNVPDVAQKFAVESSAGSVSVVSTAGFESYINFVRLGASAL